MVLNSYKNFKETKVVYLVQVGNVFSYIKPQKNQVLIRVLALIVISIVILLGLLQFWTVKRMTRDPQLTSLESGFERLKQRLALRTSFFILAVLFVIFDMELVLLMPGVLQLRVINFPFIVGFLTLLSSVFVTLLVE